MVPCKPSVVDEVLYRPLDPAGCAAWYMSSIEGCAPPCRIVLGLNVPCQLQALWVAYMALGRTRDSA